MPVDQKRACDSVLRVDLNPADSFMMAGRVEQLENRAWGMHEKTLESSLATQGRNLLRVAPFWHGLPEACFYFYA